MSDARNIRTGLDNLLPRTRLADDESCYVLSDTTRASTLKLLGAMSRDHLAAFGLRDDEIGAVEWLYEVLKAT